MQAARSPLLAVNTGWLRGDDELRRIFGSRVVDADGRDGDEGAMPGAYRPSCHETSNMYGRRHIEDFKSVPPDGLQLAP